jgi:protein-S-isoprenylcysteine O-methyltransferase Ste14
MRTNRFFERGGGWVVGRATLTLALVIVPAASADTFGHWATAVFGALLILTAGVLYVAARHALGVNRSLFPQPPHGGYLTVDGVYIVMRHPMYLASSVAGVGWALIWRSGWGLALSVAHAAFLVVLAVVEDRWLARVYPDYHQYRDRVHRFLPTLCCSLPVVTESFMFGVPPSGGP